MTRSRVSFFRVADRVLHFDLAKAFEAQETGIASAASKAFGCQIVAAMSERQINAQLHRFTHNICLGKFDQRGVNLEASALDTGFGSDIGKVLERFDKFRP